VDEKRYGAEGLRASIAKAARYARIPSSHFAHESMDHCDPDRIVSACEP
jgi:hypothetical protein